MKRIPSAELLDSDSGTPQEVADSLGDLAMINRRFGGISSSESLIQHVAKQAHSTSLSMLEVAAGAGNTPRIVQQKLQEKRIHLEVTLLDRAASHMKSENGQFLRIAGDALALPFRDDLFDLVSCNLFTHHLSPVEVVQFVDEALRVCRQAVLINDLVRDRLHLGLAYAGRIFYKSPITRNDAPASVRQAYTPQEMRLMLKQTQAARIEIQRHYMYRMGVIAWKRAG
jgi:ubiquinone/menaquinone biosynthesis C-methylase UbiE